MSHVTLAHGAVFSAEPGTTLLDAALAQGLVLEHGCRTGRCGSCKARVVAGRTAPLHLALTSAEAASSRAGDRRTPRSTVGWRTPLAARRRPAPARGAPPPARHLQGPRAARLIGRHCRISGDLAHTDIVMNQTFWLGVWPGRAPQQLDHMADKLEEFFGLDF